VGSVAAPVGKQRSWKLTDSYVWAYLRHNPLQAFGAVYAVIAVILAIIGYWIVPYNPMVGAGTAQLLPPSPEHWFGTDANGMDVFSRCIAAFRTDLTIALSGALLSAAVGAPLGVLAGYFDGRKGFFGYVSMIILRFEDVLQAFPIFVLALLMVASFGPSPINLILVIVTINHISNLRLARSEVLSLRDKSFVEASRASGNSDLRIAFVHLAPNSLTQVIGLISLVTGMSIILTAGLSFVGAGVTVPTPEWGSMIAVGAPSMITGEWWAAFFPGVFMAVTVFAFSMLGQAASALLDPLERVRLGY
jgi:peptide/nickel transport system permease protein